VQKCTFLKVSNEMQNSDEKMLAFHSLNFGLNVVTKYSNGKIIATMKHGNDLKTVIRVSYDHTLSTGENHFKACLVCLDKVNQQENKFFEPICYSYNEKNDGYSFTCNRKI
jgi:hypothetical protein